MFQFHFQTIEKLPDKVVLNIFSYLSHLEICRMGEKIVAQQNRHQSFSILIFSLGTFSQHPFVVGGDKSPMIQSCGRMFRCVLRFQVRFTF